MSGPTAPGGGVGGSDHAELADGVAAAVRSVPGVADLHGGPAGTVATYLPGRRVAGLRVADDEVEVHLAVTHGVPLGATVDAVRAAVRAVAPDRPVHVVVEDVVGPDSVHGPPAAP